MKKFIFILLAVGIYLNWGQIQNTFSPPPDFSAQHPEGVVLYATTWCGYCKKTRDFFTEHKIKFVEYDIESSAEGKQQYDQLHGSGIPLVIIHGNIVRGYNPTEMKTLLKL